ncbi:hypothetical protein GCM10025768_14370 [Microbacterium pseudoresistens]|uniref:Cardiolipin synthase N-terminal domain-containing protein n=1 Tax=Microbacterium pseudoresistens TaxID=640634 RepID=A0A7Y9ET09_9MICO|nr:PLD nuclease N-terminal domain-containing protein [Microbacterium pseudoresistens]NYD53209.1 hypothetical protein [Microbacterium pseudoresistens]
MGVVFSVLVLALMIGALIDIITRTDDQVKHLPKVLWIILVVIVPLVGGVLWFVIGREYGDSGVSMPRMRRERTTPSATPAAPTAPVDTRSTEQQIADLDREIEEWRLRAEIEKRKRENGEAGEAADG